MLRGWSLLRTGAETIDGEPYLVFCDVGQGDSVLFVAGEWQMLIDGGLDNGRALACLNRYMPEGDSKIELLVITHADSDHFGGLATIWDLYLVEMVVVPPADKATKGFIALKEKMLTSVAESKTELIHCPEGIELKPKEGIEVSFWTVYNRKFCQNYDIVTKENPNDASGEYFFVAEKEAEINNESIVTFLEIEGVRSAFLGDLEASGENQLIDEGYDGKVELLKVGHHGSRTSTSEKMLQAWRPAKAVISVGAGNSYGHPTKQTLARLEGVEAEIYRTDELGDVIFRFFMGNWGEENEEKAQNNLMKTLLNILN